MKGTAGSALVGALSLAASVQASPADIKIKGRDVDTRFPYTGPTIPVGDWVNPGVVGTGKGFPRLVEAPAVIPSIANPTNNINVISMSYVPGGINIHFQTPFSIGVAPSVKYGTSATTLTQTATGGTVKTYAREPPCSLAPVTQCSQFFYDVVIPNLTEDTTYYYSIPGGNGTTASPALSFKTAKAAGNKGAFSVAVLNDMGYTNAAGTHADLIQAANSGVAFAWHGGDISYADDWYSGILPCESDWPVCINGVNTTLPSSPLQPAPVPAEYLVPLPAGEIPNQGGPQGGDMSVLYESNWDLWQQWMNNVTMKIPYQVLPGNHEAACAEFDGPGNILTAYLDDDKANSTANATDLTYYSCPPSQRNFTAFQNRFTMDGEKNNGGRSNFWYSFDYGMAHFISLDGETDYAYSPEWPFARDVSGKNETLPTEEQTFVTDSGPFGAINGSWSNNAAYEQVQWLAKDLAAINRTKTPWVIAMSHRPMYSSETSSYQKYMRNAFEGLLLGAGVDAYLSGHIHWFERMWPIGNSTIDTSSIVNNHTYLTNPGKTMAHIVNGAAGNIESHSTTNVTLNITAYLDQVNYGFTQLNFVNETTLIFDYHHGTGVSPGIIGDSLTLIKRPASATSVTSKSTLGNPSTSSAPATTATTPHSTGDSTGLISTTGSAGSASTKPATTTGSASSGSKSGSSSASATAASSSASKSSSASGSASTSKASSASVSGTVASVSGTSTKSSSSVGIVAPISETSVCAAPSTVTAPASTVYVTVTAGASSSFSSKASSASIASASASPSAKSCPAALGSTYEYPHLIIPVSSAKPTTAFGTSYFGSINSTFSSIYNFDIPVSSAGKTCSLEFFLPNKPLVTSDYTFSGTGAIDFALLKGSATQSTTFANAPAVAKDLGTFTITPGSSTVVVSGPCAPGTVVSYELTAKDSTALYYFQDYNSPAIGLYVVEC